MFPLPLTAFEEYMLRDDRPGYPMTCVFRLQLRGRLRREPFEAALATVVDRHPLLRATVCLRRGRRPEWIDHPGWRPVIHWHAVARSDTGRPANSALVLARCGSTALTAARPPYGYPPIPALDPTQEPGVRFWVMDQAAGQDVVVQVHHATADALGFTQVIEELLIAYALRCGEAPAGLRLPVLMPQRLARRGAPGLTAWQALKKLPRQALGLRGIYRFLTHQPVPLVPPHPAIDDGVPPPAFPCPHTYEFAPAETARILAAARIRGVTVNDALIRDLFLTVARWRQRRALGSDRDWLRLAIPVNLRRADDVQMPMANAVSLVFIDRRPPEMADGDRLLRGVQRQMQWAKRGQSQYTYVQSLGLMRRLPGGLARRLQADKCRATSMLSNLGPVLTRTPLPREDGRLVSGNVVLEALDVLPPLRPHFHAAFLVFTYAGRLRIMLHVHPQALPDEQARDLLDEFVGQILNSTAEAGEPVVDRAEEAAAEEAASGRWALAKEPVAP